MFTGIIAALGDVRSVRASENGRDEAQLTVQTPFTDVVLGESIAVNGVCLTAERVEGGVLTFFASTETCARTSLSAAKPGRSVNLERALRLSDRLSGHLVQGHVDGVATLLSASPAGDSHELKFEVPGRMARYMIEKGSVALDGISLTINSIEESAAVPDGAAVISVMIIPHTWTHTTLALGRPGDRFNVEVDVIAKYAERQAGRNS